MRPRKLPQVSKRLPLPGVRYRRLQHPSSRWEAVILRVLCRWTRWIIEILLRPAKNNLGRGIAAKGGTMYHESEGKSLAASREERGYHHVRIYPADGGFHVQHHRRANDTNPERHTFNSASA